MAASSSGDNKEDERRQLDDGTSEVADGIILQEGYLSAISFLILDDISKTGVVMIVSVFVIGIEARVGDIGLAMDSNKRVKSLSVRAPSAPP